jgi:hypothetical protein
MVTEIVAISAPAILPVDPMVASWRLVEVLFRTDT